MFSIGDIIMIHSPLAGYDKYHLCIQIGSIDESFVFIFLNSDPNFASTYAVDCTAVPCLPVSKTGKTAFSFSMLPRYNMKQMTLYQAKKMGEIEPQLAGKLLKFAETVRTLSRTEHKMVLAALKQMSKKT